jgi:hypothetical protein
MSLPQIGRLVGKDPSTVGYHVKKHGLKANGADKYAPRGGIDWEILEILVEERLTIAEMARELELNHSTICYWLKEYGLEANGEGWRRRRTAKGSKFATFECKRHGRTEFVLEGSGYYRCKKCRSSAVAKRRRVVKEKLLKEAGGACAICGFDKSARALQFHHLDPSLKEFHLAQRGHSRSLARCREEIRKCVLLCANCHAQVEDGSIELPLELTTQRGVPELT